MSDAVINTGSPLNPWNYLSVYALAVKHGYKGTVTQFLEDVYGGAARADEDAQKAEAARIIAVKSASDAEAFAAGTRDGEDVPETDPAYHNNASYYAGKAGDSASSAAESEAAAKGYADHIADPVSGLVTSWLSEHVDPDTGYVIDDTLTVEDAAADAKKVGQVSVLYRGQISSSDNINTLTQPGVYYAPNGEDSHPQGDLPFESTAFRLLVVKSTQSTQSLAWQIVISGNSNSLKYRVCMNHPSPDDPVWTAWKTALSGADIDTELTTSGKAADAKAVGDSALLYRGNAYTLSLDVDALSKPGYYFFPNDYSHAHNPFPSVDWRMLDVKSTGSGHNAEWQLAVSGSANKLKFRSYYVNAWTDWETVVTTADNVLTASDIDTALTQSGKAADGKTVGDNAMLFRGSVASSTDINGLTRPGAYYIGEPTTPNWPFATVGGRLLVVKATATDNFNYAWQFAISGTGNNLKYRCCNYSGTTWTDWKTALSKEEFSIFRPITPFSLDAEETVHSLSYYKNSEDEDDLTTIYRLWDALAAEYPQFITKKTLSLTDALVESVPADTTGYSEGDTILVGNETGPWEQYRVVSGAWKQLKTWDSNGDVDTVQLNYDIHCYEIRPFSNCAYKKIVWVSGLHGIESITHVTTYLAFKKLLEEYAQHPELSCILSNHVVEVIPAAGPSSAALGLAAGPHGMSENGVNPNRDFPTGWEQHDAVDDPTGYNRTGNEPLYDPYDRMLYNHLKSLTNVAYLVNRHDSTDITDGKLIFYTADAHDAARRMETGVSAQIDSMFRREYGWLHSDYVAGSWGAKGPDDLRLADNKVATSNGGTLDKWTGSVGIRSAILEVANGAGSSFGDGDADKKAAHDADIRRMHLEVNLNLLSAVAHNEDAFLVSDKTTSS